MYWQKGPMELFWTPVTKHGMNPVSVLNSSYQTQYEPCLCSELQLPNTVWTLSLFWTLVTKHGMNPVSVLNSSYQTRYEPCLCSEL